MNSNEILKYYNRARYWIDEAGKEIARPERDVMLISICSQSRQAIADLLKTYVLLNNKRIEGLHTLGQLIGRCMEIDNRFAQFDLTGLYCHESPVENPREYCMGMPQIKKCLELAVSIKDLVSAELEKKKEVLLN